MVASPVLRRSSGSWFVFGSSSKNAGITARAEMTETEVDDVNVERIVSERQWIEGPVGNRKEGYLSVSGFCRRRGVVKYDA